MLAKVRAIGLSTGDAQRLAALRFDAIPASTRAQYAYNFKRFAKWCAEKQLAPLPAAPATLAAYVAHLEAEGYGLSTVRVACSAVHAAHLRKRVESPRYDILVREALKGVAIRRAGTPVHEMIAITPDILERLVTALPDTLAGMRDRALILVGWAMAGRRSEIARLEVSDVTWQPEGATLRIRKSKTDQEGKGEVVAIFTSNRLEVCPVRSLRAWLGVSRIVDGPIFRQVTRYGTVGRLGLRSKHLWELIKRACRAAGIPDERMGAHSLRAGFITTAAKRGRPMHVIAATSRHKDLNVLRRYIRDVDAIKNGAGKGLLDAPVSFKVGAK